ncbi:Protein transport protein SEC23 [Cucumispora dikerogammari]|nr:Protein transport protein SEC23 [Cucumispora dikerogammari]
MEETQFTQNILPTEKTSLISGCFYSLERQVPQLYYEPIRCTGCLSVINPFTIIDAERNYFICTFCQKTSKLPTDFHMRIELVQGADTDQPTLPYEMQSNSIEYISQQEQHPITFFFIIDICPFDTKRFEIMKKALVSTLETLPNDCFVGFMTFGMNVELREQQDSFVFNGKMAYKSEDIARLFDYKHSDPTRNIPFRFICKKEEFDISLFSDLEEDPFKVAKGDRQVRCTGAALSMAFSLFENVPGPCSFLLFTQGPATYGPGTIAPIKLEHPIRSCMDILRNTSIHSQGALEFYKNLTKTLISTNISINLIAFTLADIGLYEMASLIESSGGSVILSNDFIEDEYISSCKKLFSGVKLEYEVEDENIEGKLKNLTLRSLKNLNMKFNCKTRIITTKNIKYEKFLGVGHEPDTSGGKKVLYQHKMNACLNAAPLFCFEPVQNSKGSAIIQFITEYYDSCRRKITRITTVSRSLGNNKGNDVDGVLGKDEYIMGLDAEALTISIARKIIQGNLIEEDNDVVRRIDRILIKSTRSVARYHNMDPSSITFPESMELFSKFIYFLRRSSLILAQSHSPDEFTYNRFIVKSRGVDEAMTLIMPTLHSYHYQGAIQPVNMDDSSLNDDCALLLDCFTDVVIWYGSNISAWIQEGLHEKEEYGFLGEMLNNIKTRAENIINERCPTPKFTETERGGTQERQLLSRVNPTDGSVLTDDIDFDGFYNALARLITNPAN